MIFRAVVCTLCAFLWGSLLVLVTAEPGHGGGGGLSTVSTAQTRYADANGFNAVVVSWDSTTTSPGEVTVTGNGAPVSQIPGTGNSVFVLGLDAGRYTFEARAGTESLGTQEQDVVDVQFFNQGTLECTKVDDEECEIEVGTSSDGPAPTIYKIYIDGEFVRDVGGEDLVFGGPQSFDIPVDTQGGHTIEMVGVVEQDDPNWPQVGVFIGNPVTAVKNACSTTCGALRNASIAGSFDNSGILSVTSVIFGLRSLFLNETEPPCLASADANGDGDFDLSDPIHVLIYLFDGRHPPHNWRDSDNDGIADPTCRPASPENCSTSSATCL